MSVFRNPVTIRKQPVQRVVPDGTWEAQIVCDIDDWANVLRFVVQPGMGGVPGTRVSGDVVEAFCTHDTETAARGTLERWFAAVQELTQCQDGGE